MDQTRVRYRIHLLMIAFIIAIGCSGTAVYAVEVVDKTVVSFPDKALDRAIRQLAGKSNGTLYQQDLTSITELIMTYETFNGETGTEESMIQDLTGIEQLTNLEVLDLPYYHQVSNLGPLANLPKLNTVKLWDNPVRDIQPLAGLKELKELDISVTLVENLEPLRGMKQLEKLTLVDTPIKGIEVLSSLPKLRSLSIYSVEERKLDLSVLSQLTGLEEFELYRQSAVDLNFLPNMPRLKKFILVGNAIKDFSLISRLPDLEFLYIETDHLTQIDFVKSLSKLHTLEIHKGKFQNLEALAGLSHLERLSITDSGIHDLKPLASLIKLNRLSLDYNQINDVTPLAGLNLLKHLSVSHNKVRDASPLSALKELVYLDLRNNSLHSVKGISELEKLNEVYLVHNVVPIDSEPELASLRDRVQASGGHFSYESYSPFPDIVLYLNGRVYAKGSYSDLPEATYIENGRTMVPIRFLSEQLGAEVNWKQDARTVTVKSSTKQITLTVGEKAVEVNGITLLLDAKSVNSKGTVFVPLRFLSEELGLAVDYYQHYGSVALTLRK